MPAFYQKLDVVPGRINSLDVTPNKEGVFRGKCAELCGTYHSAMLFNVHIVSEQEYNDHLKSLAAKGQTGEAKGPKMPDPTDSKAAVQPAEGGRVMATLERSITAAEIATPKRQLGTISWKWLVTTDHKVIGNLYFITSMLFFLFGGILALAIRAELAFPGIQFLSREAYNQSFTMHGTIMLLLFATPLFAGFANAIMPLQIGSPDVAFPRLNMLSVLAVPVRRADHRLRLPVARPAPRARAGSCTRR